MKILKKTVLVLLILVFGTVTPAFATEETKKINLSNLNILESINNVFEKIENNASTALDKLMQDVDKRKNNTEELSQEDNSEEESEVSQTTENLLGKLKAKSESLKGSNLLTLLKERLSSIKIDLKIFDKLKNNENDEEAEVLKDEEEQEKSSNQNLTKGTESLINSFKSQENVNLIDESLAKRVDSFFTSIIESLTE